MKNKKIICLLFLILISCTGCTVEYNINITKNTVEEVINVTDYISPNRTSNDILNHYNTWYPTFVNYITDGETIELEDFSEKADGVIYHEKKINEINNGYNYTYNYTYDIDEYYDSFVLANAFTSTTVHVSGDSLVLRTGKDSMLCDYNYFDSATINITIDPEIYELNYTNTNNVNNNTYTWNIDKSNCYDSQILLTLDKKNIDTQPSSKTPDNKTQTFLNKYGLYIFLIILILIIYFGYKWFEKFKDKNNNVEDD